MAGTLTFALYAHNYQVPKGRVNILRGFKFEFSSVFSGLTSKDVLASIYTGAPIVRSGSVISQKGIVAPGLDQIAIGQYIDDLIPCYVVVGENQYISLLLETSSNYASAVEDSTLMNIPECVVTFYGNSLESIGRPVNFEPGTVGKSTELGGDR